MSAQLVFRPVTRETQADFEALFSARGSPSYCWCMAWRATSQELRDAKGPARRQQMLTRIAAGTPVGLLAYADSAPVAWVSVAPKTTFRGLGGPPPEPGEEVWSLTCMFVPRPLRGQGLAHELIAAAVSHACNGGATVLEAYPVEPHSPSYRHMGFVPAFKAAGFVHAGMAGMRRHVMRLTL